MSTPDDRIPTPNDAEEFARDPADPEPVQPRTPEYTGEAADEVVDIPTAGHDPEDADQLAENPSTAAPKAERVVEVEVFAEKEAPPEYEEGDLLHQARHLADELLERHLTAEIGAARRRGDFSQRAEHGKQLADLLLARLAVPGDTHLHERVYALAERIVAEEYGA